jgi:hypothetical protein
VPGKAGAVVPHTGADPVVEPVESRPVVPPEPPEPLPLEPLPELELDELLELVELPEVVVALE